MTACKYWDCGWCYAPNYLKTNAINSTCVNPYKCPISPLSEPVQYETPMTEIEEVKAQIKVLQSKLSFLEELEKTKSPVEEAYKDWMGVYPPTNPSVDGIDDIRWRAFQMGYNASKEEKVKMSESLHAGYYLAQKEKAQERGERLHKDVERCVRESVKWLTTEELLKPKWEPKPQSEEEVADGLKEAFVKAQQTEKWKEIQKLIDEEDNDKNFKNSLDLIKEWGEKNKPKSLYQICMEWWDEVFVNEMDDDICVDVLVNKIDKEFIPPVHDTNDYQWNKCLKMMRDKLRDT